MIAMAYSVVGINISYKTCNMSKTTTSKILFLSDGTSADMCSMDMEECNYLHKGKASTTNINKSNCCDNYTKYISNDIEYKLSDNQVDISKTQIQDNSLSFTCNSILPEKPVLSNSKQKFRTFKKPYEDTYIHFIQVIIA